MSKRAGDGVLGHEERVCLGKFGLILMGASEGDGENVEVLRDGGF